MELYKVFDYVSGIGCLAYAISFLLKKHTALPERRLVFFFFVLGFGFIFRGLSHTVTNADTYYLLERLVFVLFPIAATLYAEQMARLKLNLYYKVYVLTGILLCYMSFAFYKSNPLVPQFVMFGYEVVSLSYLSYSLMKKLVKVRKGVEWSITCSLFFFTVSTMILLFVDWRLKMVMGQERITSMIVFPFCYVAFLFSFSGEGFSIRKVFQSSLFDVFFIALQGVLIFILMPQVTIPQVILLFTILLYVRMTLKIFSVIFSSTENKKALFALEKINRLSKVKNQDFITEVKKLDNIIDARFLKKSDFEAVGLLQAYGELLNGNEHFSRIKTEGARFRLEDDLDQDAVQMITYSLDAFNMDFIYFVPSTEICFGIKFEDLNSDSSIEARAYNIFTQMTLGIFRSGGQS